MNVFSKVMAVSSAQVTPPTDVEIKLVRHFGGQVKVVKYCGRDDLVGLKVVGKVRGFRLERSGMSKDLVARILLHINNHIVPTTKTVPVAVNKHCQLVSKYDLLM